VTVQCYDASARALANATKMWIKALLCGLRGWKKVPNLVRVKERLIQNDFVAYSKGLVFNTVSWESLLAFEVAYIHGWIIFERNLDMKQKK
jgi:hypothetical protein